MSFVRIPHAAATLVSACVAIAVSTAVPQRAEAVPSFARQTGQACNACHVGGFGPQLTSYGRHFKLEGYTASNGEDKYPPISAMILGSFTHTSKKQPGGAGEHDGPNNNTALDQSSLFLAGRMNDHLGVFGQLTYSEIDRATAADNFDVRYANTFELGGDDAVFGITFNNNPSVSDVWNTAPAWAFPYVASDLAPAPAAGTLLAGGVEQAVLGLTSYLYWNNLVYGEVGAYHRLSHGALQAIGVDDSDGNVRGLAPYARLAVTPQIGDHDSEFGMTLFHGAMQPGLTGSRRDKYTDLSFDGNFDLLKNENNAIQLDFNYAHEWQNLDASFFNGDSQHRKNTLNTLALGGSYYFKDTYGITAQYFNIWGSRDTGLYAPAAIEGSRTGSPNSSGLVVQLDWTPFGKEDSWASPWVNLRVGLQYTNYLKFNGSSSNYDGSGRDASDNNTLYFFVWTAF